MEFIYINLVELPTDDHLNPHRRAELAILQLMKKPQLMKFLKSIDIFLFDEIGQISADFLATFDIILRKIRKSNIYTGGS